MSDPLLGPPTASVTTGTSALTTRRPSASQPKPLIRPTPLPPRSFHGLTSPTRGGPPSLASQATVRPYSPPQTHPTTRYPSPPISARAYSVTGRTGPVAGEVHAQQLPQGPRADELASFAQLCRALYYDKDGKAHFYNVCAGVDPAFPAAQAAQAVEGTLSRLPPDYRTAYARTMASVRSQYHRDEEIRRRAEAEAVLTTSIPGKVVMDILRISEGGATAMRSTKARQERRARLAEFIKAHCLKGLPGVFPFFRSLYAVLLLQSMQPAKGGAGRRRVEWEVDIAVFTEAGGPSWLKDSVEILKSVLGLSEVVADIEPVSYFEEEERLAPPAPPIFDDVDESSSEGDPLDLSTNPSTRPPWKKVPPSVPPHRDPATSGLLRERSSSDPFLDPTERRVAVASGPLTPPPMVPSSSYASSSSGANSSRTTTPLLSSVSPPRSTPTPDVFALARSPQPQFRIFTLPAYLTDPELRSLAALFPDFITSKARSAKFASPSFEQDSASGRARLSTIAVVSGLSGTEEGKLGHGEIRMGSEMRDEGYRGTTWERFKAWFGQCLGRG